MSKHLVWVSRETICATVFGGKNFTAVYKIYVMVRVSLGVPIWVLVFVYDFFKGIVCIAKDFEFMIHNYKVA